MKKRIVLCADDYGQALEISQGIIQLIQQKRLSATTCMVNQAGWEQQALSLKAFRGQIDIGLHFNLTSGVALSNPYKTTHGEPFFPLSRLLWRSFLYQLQQSAIEAELHAQIDQFQAGMGFLPEFIDGHQHVHQFPIIRNALIKVHQQRVPQAYIRYLGGAVEIHDFKQMIIYATGTKALMRLLIKYKIPHNSSFSGIYDFKNALQYASFFPNFLQAVQDKGLIMCHPGLATSTNQDEIATARYHEYQYFLSDQFLADCRAQEVEVGRFSECSY